MKRLSLIAAAVAANACAAAAEAERVAIPALHPDGVALTGYLAKPAGAAARAPAVVLMHGCAGPLNGAGRIRARERAWMERLAGAGYAALLVDSFNPRGVRSTCGRPTKGLSAEEDRPYDAYAALAWLGARADVDAARIALMGWSHGGTTVLAAVSAASTAFASKIAGGAPPFALAIAFYPGCLALSRTEYRVTIPLLLHLGEADDWTPARHCETLAAKARAAGGNVTVFRYPGAHHGFDSPVGEVRQRELASGRIVTNGPDPKAREEATARTMRRLADALKW